MFNEFLSTEEAKERMKHSIEEAELYKLQQQAGKKDYGMASWIVVLILILLAAAIIVY
jgi:hypothetical protein